MPTVSKMAHLAELAKRAPNGRRCGAKVSKLCDACGGYGSRRHGVTRGFYTCDICKGKGRIKTMQRCNAVVLNKQTEASMPIAAGETIIMIQGSFGEHPSNVRVAVNGAVIFDGPCGRDSHILFSSLQRWRIQSAYTANLDGELTVTFPEPHDGVWYVTFECA